MIKNIIKEKSFPLTNELVQIALFALFPEKHVFYLTFGRNDVYLRQNVANINTETECYYVSQIHEGPRHEPNRRT